MKLVFSHILMFYLKKKFLAHPVLCNISQNYATSEYSWHSWERKSYLENLAHKSPKVVI